MPSSRCLLVVLASLMNFFIPISFSVIHFIVRTKLCPSVLEFSVKPITLLYSDCLIGTFGIDCSSICHCFGNVTCDHVTGTCPDGRCDLGWQGSDCSEGKNTCTIFIIQSKVYNRNKITTEKQKEVITYKLQTYNVTYISNNCTQC